MKSGLLIVSIIMVVLVVFIVACVHRTSDIPTTIAADENTYAASSTTTTIPTPSTSKIEGLEKSRWVCGSVHNHVMVSESEDDSEQRIRNLHETVDASKELGMDFIVLTEKGSVYDVGTGGMAWQDMLKECDNVSTKDFVCIYGQEVCTPEGSKEPAGHFITIGNAEYIPFSQDVQEIFNAAHKQNALVVVAHPFYKKDESPLYYYAAWDILDWEAMEVWNGVIDESDNQKALSKLYELWNKGVRRSMTGGADLKTLSKGEILNRGEIEGYLKRGYTCLYVEKFDREGIKNAIRGGHGYVSSGPAVKGFTINNVTMGNTLLTRKNRPLSFSIDLKAYSKIKKVVLIENGLPIKVFNPGVGEFTVGFSIPALNSGWYSLEIYAEEGRAFTNAIWVDVEVSGGESIAFSGQEYPEIVEMVGQSRSDIGHAIDIIESRGPSMTLDDCRGDVCFLNALKISQDNAHLDCRGKAIRPKNNAETALLVVADNASIVNCDIESFKEGIVLRGSGSIVSNNTITNNSEGGVVVEGSHNKVFGNRMYDNRKFDVHISATGRDNIVYNNSMIDTEDRYMPYTGALGAISVSGSNNRIIGNVIKNNAEVGIKMSMLSSTDPAPSANLVAENIVENSGVLGMEVTGAVVKEPAETNIPATQVSDGLNIIYDNNFSNSRNEFGLRVRWSNNNKIIGNTIYGNNWQGIHILSADRNLVERNTISRNGREGIWMGNSNNNKIDSNAVLDNAEHCGIIFTDWNNLVSMNNTAGNNLMSGNGDLHDEKQICDEDSNFVSGNEFK